MNEPDDSAQHQDQLEKEQRLVEILREILAVVRCVRNLNVNVLINDEDIDFVAAACGKSDYRKP